MKARTTLFLAAHFLLAHRVGHGQEFPVGAWFPGLFNNQAEHFAERLDQVVEANFNTIHAALGVRNDPSVNGVFLDLAHQRGLNVLLYSWNVPPAWRTASRTYWTKTVEAEHRRFFTHRVGTRDGGALHANTADHTPGLLLDTPPEGPGVFLRYREQKLNDRGQVVENRVRHGIHVFRLKTDDNSSPERIATLRILRHSDGTLLRTRDVRALEFREVDTYQDFPIRYSVPRGGDWVRYQVEWHGTGNLWVDRIRAHDSYGYRLFSGDFDAGIVNDLAAYDGVSVDMPWRFYMEDEPHWTEKDESIAYLNDLIKAQTGKSGVAAFHQTRQDYMRHFVYTVFPSEFLVDFYTFGLYVPEPGQARYATRLQSALDSYVTWYGRAREVAKQAGIPLWAVIQAHSWPDGLRDPTPEEIRVQVNLVLAHGVTGIFYFMYSSHTDEGGRPDLQGLVDANYRITPKWREVQALNRMLGELDDTLLQLTSDAVFRGDAPESLVRRLSDPEDYHLGAFTHADGTRYLMVVNRRCRPWPRRPRTVTVELDASELNGPAWSYLATDLHTGETAATSNGLSPYFTLSLGPGEGKLFRFEPWDGQVALKGDVKVPAGVKLTLPAGTTVTFAPGDETGGGKDRLRSELIVEGALDAGAGGITFRSSDEAAESSDGDWYGIRVAATGNADLSGATIQDGLRCVETHETSTVDMTDAALVNCGQGVELLSGSP